MFKNKFSLLSFVLFVAGVQLFAQKTEKPNILFISIDDLKPILGCYGNKLVKTPNIDRVAAMGTVFLNNQCQQAVCGPTRASLMTGMRPDVTKVWDLKTKMRDMNPDILTIPQYFISQGYTTSGVGKIYHPSCVDKQNDKLSWSVPYLKAADEDYANGLGEPAFKHYQSPVLKELAANDSKVKVKKEGSVDGEAKEEKKNKGKKEKAEDGETSTAKRGPATECLDLPDVAYEDGVTTSLAKVQIIKMSKSATPYFMAVGFHKPHLPFVAPKKYWDMYSREEMPIAAFQQHAANEVFVAYESSGELRNYTDIPEFTTFSKEELRAGLKPEKQKELIHGYYAAISYVDAQLGILLNTLDSLGTLKNTVIVIWGDHGWHLGDHDMWGKHTNFEQATRSPLIFSAPGLKPGKSTSPTEHIDIFPTLCNLTGVPVPAQLEGKSLQPIMLNNKASVKEFAISQYPRKLKKEEAQKLGYANGKLMGYSLRTDKYRYTIWMNDFTSKQTYDAKKMYAAELYDYVKDPLEKVNVVNDKKYKAISADMYKKMIDFLNTQILTATK
jgi:arylsulfatase A-like enzyme